MGLSVEEKAEMVGQARKLRAAGAPEEAAVIRIALQEGRLYLGDLEPDAVELPNRPPAHGRGSSGAAWREYAAAVSDFDQEIIDSTQRKDLILMLEAHDL